MSSFPLAYVIGSSGQVAAALRSSLQSRGIGVISSSSRKQEGTIPLNLADPASIRDFFDLADAKSGGKSSEVFLPGAMTHVDRCEEEPELCRRINEEGPALVAEECKRRGHKLTFISSEYVFGEAEYHGGVIGPFSEEDEPAPSCFYGRSKLAAEKHIEHIFGKNGALLIRTTMVFSWAPSGNNFLMQYFRHLTDIAEGKSPALFRIPEDQISTPTYAPALAEAACELREKGVTGIVNIVGSDLLSRKELVHRVMEEFRFEFRRSLEGFRFLKTAELHQKARRPLSAGLTHRKALDLGVKILSLKDAFADIQRIRAKEKAGL